MNPKTILLTGLALFLFLFSIPSISAASASTGSTGTLVSATSGVSTNDRPPITITNSSDSLAGYGDFGANYSVTSVSTMLTVPSVSCSKKASNEYSFWGILVNGVNASDFAGASITAACSAGVVNYYAAWFDANVFTGCTLCQINATWTPSAGDNVLLAIAYSNYTSRFIFILADLTSRQYYLTSSLVQGVSLEFGACTSDMFLNSSLIAQPSVKFSPVSFTNCLVDGKPVGSAPNGTTVFEFFCTNAAGTGYLAKPSDLKRGQDFSIRFVATGP
jgi:hypothetical protein